LPPAAQNPTIIRYYSSYSLVFGLFIIFCVILFFFVLFLVPETKGVPLEQMQKKIKSFKPKITPCDMCDPEDLADDNEQMRLVSSDTVQFPIQKSY